MIKLDFFARVRGRKRKKGVVTISWSITEFYPSGGTDEQKAAWSRWDKAVCRLRYLNGRLDHPEDFPDFEAVYADIREARREARAAMIAFFSAGEASKI